MKTVLSRHCTHLKPSPRAGTARVFSKKRRKIDFVHASALPARKRGGTTAVGIWPLQKNTRKGLDPQRKLCRGSHQKIFVLELLDWDWDFFVHFAPQTPIGMRRNILFYCSMICCRIWTWSERENELDSFFFLFYSSLSFFINVSTSTH